MFGLWAGARIVGYDLEEAHMAVLCILGFHIATRKPSVAPTADLRGTCRFATCE